MNTYSDEIVNDVRAEFGDSAISKFDNNAKREISEAIAVYNAMTEDERDAIAYLRKNDFPALQALYAKVKERIA